MKTDPTLALPTLLPKIDRALVARDMRYVRSWSERTKAIMAAFGLGPVRAFGGLVCDVNMATIRGATPIDIHTAIQEASPWLQVNKATIERTDSGGSPTWDVIVRPA